MPDPLQNFIVFIPGYLQSRATTNQGLTLLTHEFIHTYERTGLAQIELNEWNSDWEAQAEYIARLSAGCKPTILIVAYSWGAGFGAMRLARALRDRGIEITCAILSDAVYHFGPRWTHTRFGLWTAQVKAYYPYFRCTASLVEQGWLPPRPKIVVPTNVIRVEWFLQKNSPLRGHELVWEDSNTLCHGPNPHHKGRWGRRHEVPYRTHRSMDESVEFWQLAREVADELFLPKKPPTKKGR